MTEEQIEHLADKMARIVILAMAFDKYAFYEKPKSRHDPYSEDFPFKKDMDAL